MQGGVTAAQTPRRILRHRDGGRAIQPRSLFFSAFSAQDMLGSRYFTPPWIHFRPPSQELGQASSFPFVVVLFLSGLLLSLGSLFFFLLFFSFRALLSRWASVYRGSILLMPTCCHGLIETTCDYSRVLLKCSTRVLFAARSLDQRVWRPPSVSVLSLVHSSPLQYYGTQYLHPSWICIQVQYVSV